MSKVLATGAAFDEIAPGYDGQSNPVLRLEERFLRGLFPPLRGLQVLDVGCGTGRWLRYFAQQATGSLTAVDPSRRMLDAARRHVPGHTRLYRGDATVLPVADDSADLLLMSFALSYCESLSRAATELARVAKASASFFISDLHPETERRFGWKRTFRGENGAVTPCHTRHEIHEVIAAMGAAGFHLACLVEPAFGAPEAAIFAENDKSDQLALIDDAPAIYVAQFLKSAAQVSYSLHGGQVAFGPEACSPAEIAVNDGEITAMLSPQALGPRAGIDVSGFLVLPGLINAHDHLEFGLYPNLGRGPYENCRDWAEDIHREYRDLIARHERVPKRIRLYWGGLRNLLHGVTTVCHHNPYHEAFREAEFPVRVVEHLAWAHSIGFDPEAWARFNTSPSDTPFAIHAGEGTDEPAAREIAELRRLGLLDERTVLIHAVSASESDCDSINQRGASVVACPSSNLFLYEKTIAPERLRRLRNTALGTDSPLTARGGMLDEIRIAEEAFRLSAPDLYEMCTSRPAALLRLAKGEGAVRPGGTADLVILRDNGESPAQSLRALQPDDIELVMVRGRVHLASDAALQRLSPALHEGLFPLCLDHRTVRWVRSPLAEIFAEAHKHLGEEVAVGGRRVTYVG